MSCLRELGDLVIGSWRVLSGLNVFDSTKPLPRPFPRPPADLGLEEVATFAAFTGSRADLAAFAPLFPFPLAFPFGLELVAKI